MPNYDASGPPEGNQNAVKRVRIVTDTLRRVAVQNPEKLRAACEAQLNKAVEGDTIAFKVILEAIDGRTANISIDHTGTVAHEHIAVSEATRRITEMLGEGTARPDKAPLPH